MQIHNGILVEIHLGYTAILPINHLIYSKFDGLFACLQKN